jgi:signal transduction histidine kinase
MRLGPAPRTPASSGDRGRAVDGAWRVWEVLRDLDQRFAIVVDTVVALGLFLLCSGQFAHAGTAHPNLWFVAGLTLPLILRRRAPIAVFAVLAAVALAQWAVAPPLLADAALLVGLYTVAADSEWPQVIAASAALEVGVVLATVRWAPVDGHLKSSVFLTGMVFAALLAGVVVRALRSQLGWLSERADRLEFERDQQASIAAAAERSRIAREMHDVVSHNIQVMVTLADAAAIAQRAEPERAGEAMREVSGTGRQALTDMRRMLGLLRHDDQVPGGAAGTPAGARRAADVHALAPQPGLDDLEALVERVCSTGLAVTLERRGDPFELSGAAELTVFRIIQEALTNALKHARSPQSVRVVLAFDDPEVSVEVTDDGHAAPAPSAAANGNGGGHGVNGMAERAAAFGGTLVAGPGETGGWRVATTLRGCTAPAHA